MTQRLDIAAKPMEATSPGTREALAEMHAAALATRHLPIWTVTRSPSDCPGRYVARMHIDHAGQSLATTAAVAGDTLEEVRAALPHGLIRFERDVSDDPVIVECWL